MESTVVRNRSQKNDYVYAVPVKNVNSLLKSVEGLGESKLVDHMGFGQVVKVMGDPDVLRGKLEKLEGVKYVADNVEGKIELGLFEKKTRPELTDSLREIMRKAQEAKQ